MTLVGFTALSVEMKTMAMQPAARAASATMSNENIPTGFLYQDHHLGAAMGSGNKLYMDSLAYAAVSDPAAPAGFLASVRTMWNHAADAVYAARRDAQAALQTFSAPVVALVALVRDTLSPPMMAAVGDYYLWTGQTGAQTQVDRQHSSSWYVTVTGSTQLGGGLFTIKRGPSTTANIVLTVRANGPAGTVLATKTLTSGDVTSMYTLTAFELSDASPNTPYTMTAGTYYMTLTSTAPDTQSEAYFIKNNPSDTCLLKRPAVIGNGKQCTPSKKIGRAHV